MSKMKDKDKGGIRIDEECTDGAYLRIKEIQRRRLLAHTGTD